MSRSITPGKSEPLPLLKPLARFFRALSDESRLLILHLLARNGEMSVGAIGAELHQSQPAISHHLTQLRTARLIDFRREGKFNYYRLDADGINALLNELQSHTGERPSFAGLQLHVVKT